MKIAKKHLGDYLTLLKDRELIEESHVGSDDAQKTVGYFSRNSLDTRPDTLFVCKGSGFRGKYLADAARKGHLLCWVAGERPQLAEDDEAAIRGIPYILVKDVRIALTVLSEAFYGGIWNKTLTIAAVTGTKGKSTTVCFLKSMLDSFCRGQGLKDAGLISGIYNYDGESCEKAENTTPEADSLHRLLCRCTENGLKYVAAEVSSQALKYHRTDAVNFAVGGFLNIGEDHISPSEHDSLEDYFLSKLRLVSQCRTVCANTGMTSPYGQRVTEEAERLGKEVVTFGVGDGPYGAAPTDGGGELRGAASAGGGGKLSGAASAPDVLGFDGKSDENGISFKVSFRGRTEEMKAAIPGLYNIENALAATSIALSLGLPFEAIKDGLVKARVPGRMEMFSLPGRDVKVVVDYAHNKMSYEALFSEVNRMFPGRKKLFVFGCVGDKAFNRRREAGEIAGREADVIVITEKSPGKEPFEKICADITAHIPRGKRVEIIRDRIEAVETALEKCPEGWVLIAAGNSTGGLSAGEDGAGRDDLETVKMYIEEHR